MLCVVYDKNIFVCAEFLLMWTVRRKQMRENYFVTNNAQDPLACRFFRNLKEISAAQSCECELVSLVLVLFDVNTCNYFSLAGHVTCFKKEICTVYNSLRLSSPEKEIK